MEASPFPDPLKALDLIRDGLNGDAYYMETIFNSWNVAEKLSSKEELYRLKTERPQPLLEALDAIAKCEVNHTKLAIARGASGVLLSVDNAKKDKLSPADYQKFSAPFGGRILEETRFGDSDGGGRKQDSEVLMEGIDEVNCRKTQRGRIALAGGVRRSRRGKEVHPHARMVCVERQREGRAVAAAAIAGRVNP